MVKVSVIVNCYNESPFVREAVDSVFAQTYDDWEIVFWDNASSDDSGEIAASYGQRVRYFRAESMTNLTVARNRAFAQANGEYMAILDADDIWLPRKLERQVQLLDSKPELGLAFCDAIWFDHGGDRYRLFQVSRPHQGHVFGHLITENFMYSSAMIFRREALEGLDCFFDERYIRSADYDLSLRMAYNYSIDYVDEPLAKVRWYDLGEKPWKRTLIPRVVEIRSIMENLIEAYPDIPSKYQAQLPSFYKQLEYLSAIDAWQNGRGAEARRYLSRYISTKKFALVYFLTFLMPHRVYDIMRRAYRHTVTATLARNRTG